MADPLHSPPGEPTTVAVAGHPVHPMLITFPVAFLSFVLLTDIMFLWTQDPFWARASFWMIAAGSVMGLLAGLAGTVEVLAVRGIRLRAAAWNHFIAAMVLLSIAFANLAFRLPDPVSMVYPWGIYLSALGAVVLGLAGWLGGHLVFQHQVGVEDEDDAEDQI